MSEEKKILDVLQHLVNVWEGSEDDISVCVSDEPFIYMSMFSNMYSGSDLKAAFRKPAGTDLKISIFNHAAVVKGNRASQYATVIGLFTKPDVPYMHLAFGGTFVNELNRTDNTWKLSVIRFNLQLEDSVAECRLTREGMIWRAPGYGNRSFISGWKTIDDRIGHNMADLPNMGGRMISPDYDTPWYKIKDRDEELSDEQQISELLYRFTCGFDLATFHLLSEAFADDVFLKLTDEEFSGRRDVLGYLKMLRKSTPRAHNSVIVDSLDIQDDTAVLKATRIAPDLRNLRYVSEDFRQWKDGTFTLEACRNHGKWTVKKLTYEKEGAR